MQESIARGFEQKLLACLIVLAGALVLGTGPILADEVAAAADASVASQSAPTNPDSQTPESQQATAPAAEAAVPVAAQSMRLYLDPETGEMTSVPSAAQMEALDKELTPEERKALDRSSDDLTPVRLPDGKGVMVDLQGRFQSVATVHMSADGQPQTDCNTTAEKVVKHITEGSETSSPDTEQ